MNTRSLLQRLQAPRYALAGSIGVGIIAWYGLPIVSHVIRSLACSA